MYLSVNFLTLTKVSTPTPPPHLRTMRVPWSLPGERIAPLVVKNKGLEYLGSFFSELNSPVSLHFISLNFKTGGPNCTTNTSNCSYDSPLPCGRQKTKMKKFQCIALSQEQSHIQSEVEPVYQFSQCEMQVPKSNAVHQYIHFNPILKLWPKLS